MVLLKMWLGKKLQQYLVNGMIVFTMLLVMELARLKSAILHQMPRYYGEGLNHRLM